MKDKKVIEKWAELLLDIGKRNNLINFKDSKGTSVEVLLPDAAQLLEKTDSNAAFEVFDPRLQEDPEEDEIESAEEGTDTPLQDAEEDTEAKARQEYLDNYKEKLKKKQILLYNKDSAPVTAIKNIDKKATLSLEETGVNVAYMAFGFIHWHENSQADRSFAAPILLAPIKFKNASAIKPYYIHMTEEDVIVNPTFNFKMEHDYKVSLPEYKDQDFHSYMDEVELLAKKLGFTVTRDCKIGLFSFLKMNMYRDLMDHADEILANPIIRSLAGNPDQEPAPASEIRTDHPISNPLLELHNVVDADSSQLEAVAMAKSGKSFVLQGPPGTGKSQTITNIIAESLYDGKKVLFVSAKQAALNVVYDKLTKAGLGEFCLELHSYKANKKQVIEELCQTLKKGRSKLNSQVQEILKEKELSQEELDQYTRLLHEEAKGSGFTLYDFYEIYSANRDCIQADCFLDSLEQKGKPWFNSAKTSLDEYLRFTKTGEYDYRLNPWYGFYTEDNSMKAKSALSTDLKTVSAVLDRLSKNAASGEDFCRLGSHNYEESMQHEELFGFLAKSNYLLPSWMNLAMGEDKLSKEDFESGLRELMHAANDYQKCRQELLLNYSEEVLNLNADKYLKLLTTEFTGGFSRLFNKQYKQIINDYRFASHSGKKPSYEEAIELSKKLVSCHVFEGMYNNKAEGLRAYFKTMPTALHTDWNPIFEELNQLQLYAADPDQSEPFGDLSVMTPDEFLAAKPFLAKLARTNHLSTSEAEAWTHLCGKFDPDQFDLRRQEFSQVNDKLAVCSEHMEELDYWCSFATVIRKLKEQGILDLLDNLLDHQVAQEDLLASFEKNYALQWIDHISFESDNPILRDFSKVTQDSAVFSFSNADKKHFLISTAQIKEKLSALRPSLDLAAPNSSVSILLREGEKKRKQKSIRTLFAQAGELIARIKPCLLMSPLSVSTYLDNDSALFDLVIFDEASQIFPQDAIGAIYRGAQLIVVGDSRQMPPSDFFNSSSGISDDEDEEIADAVDYESILDMCNTVLPSKRLKWHYRSRYEQLIAFSNKNFYDGDLVSFPSSITDHQGIGVDYYYVDGIFEHKTRRNKKEAHFIVDLIWQNIEKYPHRSLGVVAFSISQQDYIEKLLTAKRIQDPSKEAFFSSDQPEPFFIKNLETVQGDERDTIIFSIAYAKDSDGKLMHNFGPLNRVGGERRLNVAITRAKCNIQVVSSIHGTDINPNRTHANGALLLRDYLTFAENGFLPELQSDALAEHTSALEDEVYDFLTEHGYELDRQVGCSAYKIDLALKNKNGTGYAMAICLDGINYSQAANTRDRDRLRQEVLERMGWNFYRLWSTDWIRNPKAREELLLQCQAALEKAEHTVSEDEETPILVEVEEDDTSFTGEEGEIPIPDKGVELSITDEEGEIPSTGVERGISEEKNIQEEILITEEVQESEPFEFPLYPYQDLAEVCGRADHILNAIHEVLLIEGPVAEEWMMRRLLFYFGQTKLTSRVKADYEALMKECLYHGILRREGFLYAIEGESTVAFRVPSDEQSKRPIPQICPEELAEGMRIIIHNNGAIDKEDLYKMIIHLAGFSKKNDAIVAQLDKAFELLNHQEDEEEPLILG